MKHTLLATVSIAALSICGQAGAADLPSKAIKAPVAAPFIASWTGVYVGGQVGFVSGGLGGTPLGDFGMTIRGDLAQTFAGVHAGYNHQFNKVVIGIEGDVNARFGEGHFSLPKLRTFSSWDASIRARLGLLLSPRSLVYVTAGGAFGDFKTSGAEHEPSDDADILRNRVGWTVGGGFQYALDSNWSTRIEYRYTDWGAKSITMPSGDPSISSGLSDQRVMVAMSYKLGAADPWAAGSAAAGGIYKAPPVARPIYSWTGFYVGGHVGTSAGQMDTRKDVPIVGDPPESLTEGGFTQVLAGIHAGYNYQFNNFVVGFEGDYNGKFGAGWASNVNSRPQSDWDASIRARLGVLVTPRSLAYITGGFAFGHFTTPRHEFDPADTVELLGGDRTGWTLGAGVEYALDSNWNTRIEYRYTDWGTKNLIWFDEFNPAAPSGSKLIDSRATVGLTYKPGSRARFGERDAITVNWTGTYAGGHIGAVAAKITYGNGNVDLPDGTGNEFGEFTQGFVGGFAGYNHQFANRVVIGVEGEINGKFGHGWKFDDLLRPTSSWDGSIRGRLGYAASPRALVYATGGFAFGRFSTPQAGAHEPDEDPVEEHIGKTRTGWTVGGGIQYALDANWSARIEYRHTDWGTKTITNITDFTCPDSCPETVGATLKDDRVAVGFSYKFGGPVVARY
jgi:outer membrane immunogenic protein